MGLTEVLQKHHIQNAGKDRKIVFVHFGVASSNKDFKLETVAWNGKLLDKIDIPRG